MTSARLGPGGSFDVGESNITAIFRAPASAVDKRWNSGVEQQIIREEKIVKFSILIQQRFRSRSINSTKEGADDENSGEVKLGCHN